MYPSTTGGVSVSDGSIDALLHLRGQRSEQLRGGDEGNHGVLDRVRLLHVVDRGVLQKLQRVAMNQRSNTSAQKNRLSLCRREDAWQRHLEVLAETPQRELRGNGEREREAVGDLRILPCDSCRLRTKCSVIH